MIRSEGTLTIKQKTTVKYDDGKRCVGSILPSICAVDKTEISEDQTHELVVSLETWHVQPVGSMEQVPQITHQLCGNPSSAFGAISRKARPRKKGTSHFKVELLELCSLFVKDSKDDPGL